MKYLSVLSLYTVIEPGLGGMYNNRAGDTQGYLMLQKTYYAQMEVSQMKTNPMLRRGLGRIKFEAVKGEEVVEIARKFASSSKE